MCFYDEHIGATRHNKIAGNMDLEEFSETQLKLELRRRNTSDTRAGLTDTLENMLLYQGGGHVDIKLCKPDCIVRISPKGKRYVTSVHHPNLEPIWESPEASWPFTVLEAQVLVEDLHRLSAKQTIQTTDSSGNLIDWFATIKAKLNVYSYKCLKEMDEYYDE